jgi:hypothetical protein
VPVPERQQWSGSGRLWRVLLRETARGSDCAYGPDIGQETRDAPEANHVPVTAILADGGPPSPYWGPCNNRTEFVRTPRPTRSRVTVAGGRSPGSRVAVSGRLPRNTGFPVAISAEASPLTVAGAAAALSAFKAHAPRSLLIPYGNHREQFRRSVEAGQASLKSESTQPRDVRRGAAYNGAPLRFTTRALRLKYVRLVRHILQAGGIGGAADHARYSEFDLPGCRRDDAAHRQRALADLAPTR